jgi:hypothetical protein
MTEVPATVVCNVYAFQREDGDQHALLAFQPEEGKAFALAFSSEALIAMFRAVVAAIGQWSTPEAAHPIDCAIVPSRIGFRRDPSSNGYALDCFLDRRGGVSFVMDEETSQGLLEAMTATLPRSTATR